MLKCLRKEVIFCFITDPEQLSSSPWDMETSPRRDFVTFQEFINFLFFYFFKRQLMFFPWLLFLEGWHSMATSAQPMLQLTQGEGKGREGEGVRGLSYLISVSTRASVWCKRVGVFFSHSPPYFTFLFLSLRGLQVPRSPRHPVHSVPFPLCSENLNISFSFK